MKLTHLPKTSFKLKFTIDQLLTIFKMQDYSPDNNDFDFGYYPDDNALLNTIFLDIHTREVGYGFYDRNEKLLSQKAIDEIKGAIISAQEMGMQARYFKAVKDCVALILDDFGNYQYEYWYETENGERTASGYAKGIEDVEYKKGYFILTCNPDIVHIINNCICGVGMFGIVDELDMSVSKSLAEYVSQRLHWLNSHFEIYGERKPKPYTDNIDDFDEEYFKDELARIEKEYKIRIT